MPYFNHVADPTSALVWTYDKVTNLGDKGVALISHTGLTTNVRVVQSDIDPDGLSNLVPVDGALLPVLGEWQEAADAATYQTANNIA